MKYFTLPMDWLHSTTELNSIILESKFDYSIRYLENRSLHNFNTLRPSQISAISQTTFSNAFPWMKMYEFRLRFYWRVFPKVRINNIPALVQLMVWHRLGEKPLSEPMMVSLLTHICAIRPQWNNTLRFVQKDRHFTYDIFICIFLNETGIILINFAEDCYEKFIWQYVRIGPIMAWCRQAVSLYCNLCWLVVMTPYGVKRPQWVNVN